MEQKTVLVVFFCFVGILNIAAGNECRTSKTVASSAQSVAKNSQQGGHIWQHIRGLTATPEGAQKDETQLGKTLFASESDFTKAWTTFQGTKFTYLTPRQCKVKQLGQSVDCVLASDLNVKVAYTCSAINKSTKICANYNATQVPKYIEFWYARKNGKWVLNTAYPSDANTHTSSCHRIQHEALDEEEKTQKDEF